MTRLAFTLIALPFLVWLMCRVLPQAWVIEVGDIFRQLIWTEVPVTALKFCGPVCRDLVFGMVVLPATWLAGIIGAIFWYGATKQRVEYHQQRLHQQATTATSAMDSVHDLFRRRPFVPVMFVLSLIFLNWWLPTFVGDLRYHLDGRKTVFTTWRFSILCAVLGLAIAGLGPFVFVTQRLATRANT